VDLLHQSNRQQNEAGLLQRLSSLRSKVESAIASGEYDRKLGVDDVQEIAEKIGSELHFNLFIFNVDRVKVSDTGRFPESVRFSIPVVENAAVAAHELQLLPLPFDVFGDAEHVNFEIETQGRNANDIGALASAQIDQIEQEITTINQEIAYYQQSISGAPLSWILARKEALEAHGRLVMALKAAFGQG